MENEFAHFIQEFPKLIFDFGKPLSEAIAACQPKGPYGISCVSDNVTEETFPAKRWGRMMSELALFTFNVLPGDKVRTYEVIRRMRRVGYRPGYIEEMLALYEHYGERLSSHHGHMLAFGSICITKEGYPGAPYILGRPGSRLAVSNFDRDISAWDYRWNCLDMFVACKSSTATKW